MNNLIYENCLFTIYRYNAQEQTHVRKPVTIKKFKHMTYLCSKGGKQVHTSHREAMIAASTRKCPKCGAAILGSFTEGIE